MFELANARDSIMSALTDRIPVDTGQLRNLFFDNGTFEYGDTTVGVNMMQNPLIYYGFILNNSPTIRYRLKKQADNTYSYEKKINEHFGFIDRFFENEAVSIFERELGVKRIL